MTQPLLQSIMSIAGPFGDNSKMFRGWYFCLFFVFLFLFFSAVGTGYDKGPLFFPL